MYGKLTNDFLYYAPKNFTTDTGEVIVNFDKNDNLMKQYGYKEVVKDIPDYDRHKQKIAIEGYEETEDLITVKYVVIDITTTESLEQRVASLENNINELATVFDEEVNK